MSNLGLVSTGLLLLVLVVSVLTSFQFISNAQEQVNVTIVSEASTLNDKAFQPNPLKVSVGTTVVWTNDDFGLHTITDNNVAFDSGTLRPDDTFEYTLDKTRTYAYHCMLRPSMVGRVVVL
ncbi:MAG: hypothetical protein WBX81_14210 [Nitrososphaeraceae archaeon]